MASAIASARIARTFARASARACSTSPGASSAARAAIAACRSGAGIGDGALELLDALAQLAVLMVELAAGLARQRRVGLPPVDPHLAGPVDGGDEQPQLDRQQLDVEEVDLDVTRDDDALVEHALEDVGEARGVVCRRHRGPGVGEALPG